MENFKKRNEDFFAAVCRVQAEGMAGKRRLSLPFAVKKVLKQPAPSFYLTREHVWKQLRERRRRLPPHEKPHRRRMWEEIEEALRRRMAERPREDAWVALDYVLAHHRPSGFFLTDDYAVKLAYRMMRRGGDAGRSGNE